MKGRELSRCFGGNDHVKGRERSCEDLGGGNDHVK